MNMEIINKIKSKMKLYTEEQVRIMIGKARLHDYNDEALYSDNDLIEEQTPIELPTYDKVTRLEVISEKGRELVKYGVNVELQLQDEDRTLKVFNKIIGGNNE